jgi:REP element-mobilizing transposase RayT
MQYAPAMCVYVIILQIYLGTWLSLEYKREKHQRRSLRLQGYDYTNPGAYFITVSTWNRECLFGGIVNGLMKVNEYGEIVRDEWVRTEDVRPNISLDEFVIMPNHFHGILFINDDGRYTSRGTLQRAPTVERFGKPVSNSIPTIVRLFKSTTTKQINLIRNHPGMPVWQRNYYEHVVRNEKELFKIRKYIKDNPLQWELDVENPQNMICP